MINIARGKRLYLVLTSLLMLTVTVIAIYSTAKTMNLFQLEKTQLDSRNYLAEANYTVDWLVEEDIIRNGTFNVFMPYKNLCEDGFFAGMPLKIFKTDTIPILKETIILNLRI